jgi:hypothetical protein
MLFHPPSSLPSTHSFGDRITFERKFNRGGNSQWRVQNNRGKYMEKFKPAEVSLRGSGVD